MREGNFSPVAYKRSPYASYRKVLLVTDGVSLFHTLYMTSPCAAFCFYQNIWASVFNQNLNKHTDCDFICCNTFEISKGTLGLKIRISKSVCAFHVIKLLMVSKVLYTN